MTTTAAKTAVQAFICCRLDYCNSILYGMSDGLLRKVQSIQNAAARLVTGARRCDHITPVLRQLHWLPVRQRVEYKVACLVHQSLAGQTPAYIADDIQLVTDSDRRQLRSPLPGHASSHGHITISTIEASVLQAPACGTAYHHTCDET